MLVQLVVSVVTSVLMWVIGLLPGALANLDIGVAFDTGPIVDALSPAANLLPMDALAWVLSAKAGLIGTDAVLTGWGWFRGGGRP